MWRVRRRGLGRRLLVRESGRRVMLIRGQI